MENMVEYDRLMWLDADAVLTADFPRLLIELISLYDVLSTHFSVWHNKNDIEYSVVKQDFLY